MKSSIRTLCVFVGLGFASLGFAVEQDPNTTAVAAYEDFVSGLQANVIEEVRFEDSFGDMFGELLEMPNRTIISKPWRTVSSTARTDIVLVIPTAQSLENTPDLIGAATKDLNIMCRIFDKQLNLSGVVTQAEINLWQVSELLQSTDAGGLPSPLGPQEHNAKAIFLDGYGVLFLMNVNFPLTAALQHREKKQQDDGPVDQVWKKAEQELYFPHVGSKIRRLLSSAEYNAKRIEEFKTNLIEALKHAANIRSLKPDEWVVVTVSGSRVGGGMPKVLIARAKKSEIDAFSKGALDFDRFRQKVGILISPDDGRGRAPEKATGRSDSHREGDKKMALEIR